MEQARADLFNSIYHADAVAGINTSVLLEAAIIGRRTLTVLDPEIAESQTGMTHFGHLQRPGGLKIARDFAEHLEHLDAILAQPSQTAPETAAFVEFFIRPRGINQPATEIVVDAIESVVGTRPAPLAVPWYAPIVKAAMIAPAYWIGVAGSERNSKKWSRSDRFFARLRREIIARVGLGEARDQKGTPNKGQSGTTAPPRA